MSRAFFRSGFSRALLVLVLAASAATTAATAAPPPEETAWVPLQGSWSAEGRRQVLRAGTREAATTTLSGALVLARGEGLRKGFRAEAMAWTDGGARSGGVMVLTDDRGDQVFCGLTGFALDAGTLIVATFTGGTGFYSGIEGELSFHWVFLEKEGSGEREGEVQGLARDLKGRYRLPSRKVSK